MLTHARQWLAKHIETPDARFVLPPLLAWTEERLGKKVQAERLTRAREWLAHHLAADDAEYILNHLLRSPLITPDERTRWARRSLDLARDRERFGEVTHLLKTLLMVAGRFPDEVPAGDIVRFSGQWLDHHPDHAERGFVLARILRLAWMPDDAWTAVAKAALRLAASRAPAHDDDYLLNGIMTRIVLLSPDEISRWLDCAHQWINICAKSNDAVSLLTHVNNVSNVAVRAMLRGRLDIAYRSRFPTAQMCDWDTPLRR